MKKKKKKNRTHGNYRYSGNQKANVSMGQIAIVMLELHGPNVVRPTMAAEDDGL